MNPPEAQLADTADKRRKQIEKAKAAHLSRQLQTRLQYARLKVDHGWQKQTLNEVENLYFHHYRARAPPRRAQKIERFSAGTPSAQGPPELPLAPANPTPSSSTDSIDPLAEQELSLPILPQSSTPSVPDESEPVGIVNDPLAAESSIITSTGIMTSAKQPLIHSTSPIVTPPTPQSPLATQYPTTKTPPLRGPPTQSHPITNLPSFSTIAATPTPSFIASPTTSRNSLYPQPSPSSMRSKGVSSNMRPSPSAIIPLSIPGSSHTAMTYDSFWSSHSTTNNYRDVASFTSPARCDVGMGLPNLGTGFPFTMGASHAPIKPLPPPKKSGVVHKRSVPAATSNMKQGLTGADSGG